MKPPSVDILTVIPKPHAEQIGLLAAETAMIDNLLTSLLPIVTFEVGVLDKIKQSIEKIECLAGGDGFEVLLKKLDKISTLNINDGKLISEFGSIKKKLGVVSADRSRYVHSYWYGIKIDNVTTIKRGKIKRDMNSKREMREHFDVEFTDLTKAVKNATDASSLLTDYLIRVRQYFEQKTNSN